MAGKISIIGLGEIGTSFAMALSRFPEYQLTGSDFQKEAEDRALQNGWVSSIQHNIFSAVQGADAVLLAVPEHQTRKTLELVGQDLDPETLVLDCCPNKAAAAEWSAQYMAHPENFLGIWPVVNPQYRLDMERGGAAARPDYFRDGTMFIAAQPGTGESAIKLAAGLADLLEMKHTFAEPVELDGLIAATWNLPLLSANALMNCLKSRSGWNDGKKAAGKEFYGAVSPLNHKANPDEEYGGSFFNNSEAAIRVLDEYISALSDLRDALKDKDEARFSSLLNEGETPAFAAKQAETHSDEYVTGADMMKQTFLGGFLRKKRPN